MVEIVISDLMKQLGRTWTVGGKPIEPTDNDVERVLDEAVRQLYNEPVGNRLNVGGLIIEKTTLGYDVYLHVGSYK